MLLFEHEGKAVLEKYGIEVPGGTLIRSADELDTATAGLIGATVIKAQVLTGGRGKAGGIKSVESKADARREAETLLAETIKGHRVQAVLIEPKVSFSCERYLAVLLDGADILLLFGSKGGVEVESYFGDQKGTFQSVKIDPVYGLSAYQVRNVLETLRIERTYWPAYADVADRLYRLFCANDATLAEINPLVEIGNGKLLALDARIVIDDGALFRHPEFVEAEKSRFKEDGFLARLKELEIQYVPIGGSVGLVSSGAGVGVTVMDWLDKEGVQLSAFVDLDYAIMGGHAETGIRLMLDTFCDDPSVKVIIVNFTTCGLRLDQIVQSLLAALAHRNGNLKPIYFHLEGNRSEVAHAILRDAGCTVATSLGDAVRAAARIAKKA
ncbi:MAG: ATP-grasp domain-containing protein [Variibacter sp.]